MTAPTPETAARVAALLGWSPDTWRQVARGYTPARRYVVGDGSRSAFVKIGATPLTARMVNQEIDAYRLVAGPFMARLIGAESHDTTPILILEDLAGADWPPPWTPATIDAALAAIAALHATTPPPGIRTMEPAKLGGWAVVAADPAPFLSLGLVTAGWLTGALPALLAAEATPPAPPGCATSTCAATTSAFAVAAR